VLFGTAARVTFDSRFRIGEELGTQRAFSDALINAGFKRCSIGHARGFAGLVLKASSG
jgi:hypothetical protein